MVIVGEADAGEAARAPQGHLAAARRSFTWVCTRSPGPPLASSHLSFERERADAAERALVGGGRCSGHAAIYRSAAPPRRGATSRRSRRSSSASPRKPAFPGLRRRIRDTRTSRGRLVHDMLTATRSGLTIDDAAARGLLHPNGEWRLLSPEQMADRWQGREEGLRETVRVAEECTGFTLDWMRPPLPDFRKAKLAARLSASDDNVVASTRGPTKGCASAGASRRSANASRSTTSCSSDRASRLRGILSRDGRRRSLRAAQRTFSARGAAARPIRRWRSVSHHGGRSGEARPALRALSLRRPRRR